MRSMRALDKNLTIDRRDSSPSSNFRWILISKSKANLTFFVHYKAQTTSLWFLDIATDNKHAVCFHLPFNESYYMTHMGKNIKVNSACKEFLVLVKSFGHLRLGLFKVTLHGCNLFLIRRDFTFISENKIKISDIKIKSLKSQVDEIGKFQTLFREKVKFPNFEKSFLSCDLTSKKSSVLKF